MSDLVALLKRFSSYYKDYIPQFALAIIGMIFTAAGTAASAYLAKPILDDIFVNKDENLLYILPYAIVAVYGIKSVGRYLQDYFTSYIGQDIVRRLRNKLLNKMLHLDIEFFNKFRSGELISRSINDIERIRRIVSRMVPQFIREVITIFGLLGVALFQSPYLSIFAFMVLPLAFYPLSRLAKKMKKLSFRSQEKNSDITSILSEIFNNIEIIKVNNAKDYELENFKKHNYKFFKVNMRSTKIDKLTGPMMEMFGSVGMAAVVIIGGKQVIDGTLSVGSFFAFFSALGMLYTPVKRLSTLYNSMQDAIAAAERTFDILDYKQKIKSGFTPVSSDIKSVEFKNVSLTYENHQALKDINLQVQKGDFIALIGESGGGKTSLVNLIVRFFDTTNGGLYINGVNIKDYNIYELRDKISFVTQRVYIFNDTVAANVAYGKEIDEQKVIAALEQANAYAFVNRLENGIHTELDEFGTNLSGGQRQRIAIARALYNDPQILILDEATSALDNTSEQKITEVLENVVENRITFVIAHRLSTIKKANKVALLKHGQIVDFGSHDELSKNSEEFQKLKGTYR